MRLGKTSIAIVVLALGCLLGSAFGQAATGYQRSMWSQKEGAPAGIQAMARTSDGWLWLGTNAGLFQFDGLTFGRREILAPGDLRSRSVVRLAAMSSGDLWVFLSAGGVIVLPKNDRDHPVAMTGLPDQTTYGGLAEDTQGHVWATAGKAIYRSSGATWQAMAPDSLGLPVPDDPNLRNDQAGNLWYGDQGRFWVRKRDSPRFVPVPGSWGPIGEIIAAMDGRVWVLALDLQVTRLQELPDVGRAGAVSAFSESDQMMIDKNGVVWSVACDTGDLCIKQEPTSSTTGAARVESSWKVVGDVSKGAMCVLIDADGNIWIGTKGGLMRLRTNAATPVPFPDDTYYFSVFPGPDGAVYAGTDSRNGTPSDRLWRLGDTATPVSGLDHPVSVWTREDDGTLLLAGEHGAWSFDGSRLQTFDLPIPWSRDRPRPQAMASDAQGRLWIAYPHGAPWRRSTAGWQERGGIPDLPDTPIASITRVHDDLWFGYRDNKVAIVEANDRVTVLDQHAGLALGSVNVILATPPLLAGGERGLQWFDGHAFHFIRAQHPELLSGITGVLRDKDGSLWINGFAGLVHFAGADVARAMHDATVAMPGRLYDNGDGVAGAAQQVRPLPTLTRGPDGRIWVASSDGLAWIDPKTMPRNTRKPELAIRDINGNRPSHDETILPAGTTRVGVGFDVLSLTRPDRVDVRYRLVGNSNGWVSAGTRRDVMFDHLPPGHYRFEVIAANEDGVWNLDAATVSFAVQPMFYQTVWFKLLCVLVALVLAWGIFRLRLRQERTLIRQKMAVRHAERERIARELHDTLLQGISGLLMRVQAWTRLGDLSAEVRGDMERAGEQARQMLTQGRDRIAHLRADDDHPVRLADGLQAIGENLSALHGKNFHLVDHAPEATFRHDVATEVCAIVHEAIANAHAHSGGQAVTVTLERRGDGLAITIADDGRGVTDAEVEEAAKSGHWGVVGMRERARRIGARFSMTAGGQGGTTVTIERITPKA
ncbi:two-component regulator propeller domain-containing protein [Pinirhizobacter soli]|uniref:sensor histidine kinase n=1 Tax=Pinirhizobacter soli TaxID=2786953 RepID=UPI00202A6AE2